MDLPIPDSFFARGLSMTLKRTLLLACVLMLLPWSAFAKDKPVVYTIKKGDTLWGISQRFLKDPYYWPNLWANNPELPNPHFIYPGQQVKIYDGRIEIVPAPAAAPQPATATASTAAPATAATAVQPPQPEPTPPAPAEPEVKIAAYGANEGFVAANQISGVGTVVDTTDNRLMITRGNSVFMDMRDLAATKVGMFFNLFEPGDEIVNPATGELVGYRVTNLGTVQITDVSGSVATGVVTTALREILRGARLAPYEEPVREVTLKKTDRNLKGYVVGAGGNQITLGKFDVIYLNLGSNDGLEQGNMLNISRPRMASELALKTENFQAPEVLLGNAVVIKTEPTTAVALIVKMAAPIFRGDRVSTMVP